jgi:DNA-directed RNA polymerase sigma subunit (sigma70/sigma32)
MSVITEILKPSAPRRRQGGRTMSTLTEKETAVLRMRFDDAQRVATLQEVAGLLRMPLDTARRIERRALRKLRRSALGPVAQGFDGWDEA